MHNPKIFAIIFFSMFLASSFCVASPIDLLEKEPPSLFDLAMFRLQNDFFMGRDYDAAWFKRQYKGIEFTLDMVRFWPSKQWIMIHRDIHAKADLSNCTIAVETLRDDLLSTGGVDKFIQKYFWHFGQIPPQDVIELKQSIYLVGEVYDPNASSSKSQFLTCESRLDKSDVSIVRERRVYK